MLYPNNIEHKKMERRKRHKMKFDGKVFNTGIFDILYNAIKFKSV